MIQFWFYSIVMLQSRTRTNTKTKQASFTISLLILCKALGTISKSGLTTEIKRIVKKVTGDSQCDVWVPFLQRLNSNSSHGKLMHSH